MFPLAPIGDFSTALLSWHDFYVLLGAAAATLTGLMFIAVTFGAGLVNRQTLSAARAFIDPTYTHFGHVLFTAALMTMPVLDATALAVVLGILTVARIFALAWVYRQLRAVHARSGDLEFSDWFFAILAPLVVYVVLLGTTVAFWEGLRIAFVGLAVVTMALLAIGVINAWELVLWMAVVVGRGEMGGDELKDELREPRGGAPPRAGSS